MVPRSGLGSDRDFHLIPLIDSVARTRAVIVWYCLLLSGIA